MEPKTLWVNVDFTIYNGDTREIEMPLNEGPMRVKLGVLEIFLFNNNCNDLKGCPS